MFGRKERPSVAMPVRRWFFKVHNVADANEATKICYQVFFAVTAIQAIAIVSLSILGGTPITYLYDPILKFVLAWFIDHKKSRTAAVLLGFGAVYVFVITLANKIGMQIISDGLGGKNIILAVLALYGIYKGLQGTFQYHQLSNNKVIVKNVWKMLGLFLLYNTLAFGIFMLIALYLKLQQQEFWRYVHEDFSNDAVGGAVILCMILASASTAFRILPWTKNKPLVARTTSATGSTEPS